MHNSKGQYTNAVYGFTKFLLNIINTQDPEYLAVVFDKSRDTFRREMYPEYKAQRSETPQPLKEQFLLMEQMLSELGIKVLYSDTYEADDLAGSILKEFEHHPHIQPYFITKDADYMQLINECTRGWMYMAPEKIKELRKKYYDFWEGQEDRVDLPDRIFEFTEATCESEYGVKPCQIPDLKGLVGDKSDNIPGVSGVGETSAVPLLHEYGTIEELYREIESVEGDSRAEKELNAFWKTNLGISRSPLNKLKGNKEMAMLSKRLATIKTDCEIDRELSNYRIGMDEGKLREHLEELGFESILNSLDEITKKKIGDVDYVVQDLH